MKLQKIPPLIIGILCIFSLCCCVPEEIILPGNISGYVTDATTSEPLMDAAISLSPTNDSTQTINDGSYIFKNLEEGHYQIQAYMPAYKKVTENVAVSSANTTEFNFGLDKSPYAKISVSYLDFGIDSTIKYFTISNIGAGTLSYDLSTSKDWITVDPEEGDITTETDTIKVILERTGLPKSKIVEEINILSYVSEGTQLEKVDVWANGVADDYGNYYGVVTIGTQTWFAENLNSGIQIQDGVGTEQTDNEIIEKYCYENLESNCATYGGMYSWYEMMNYDRAEGTPKSFGPLDGVEYISQGICPTGWHIPTLSEWETLLLYLGQPPGGAGGKMKATGTLEDGTGLWLAPNTAATNESGFTGLPAGDIYNDMHWRMGEWAIFWTTFQRETGGITYSMTWSLYHMGNAVVGTPDSPEDLSAVSVRCIKDPE